jgi:cytochrome c2
MWLKAFLKNPESPDPKRRKMPNQNLSEDEIKKLIAYFKWVDAIDTNQWPPKPVGEAKPQEVALKEKSQNLLGKNVFDQYRCDLCHKIEGRGGTIGPDLSHEGNKRDALWLEKHIRDPKSHDPNTVMPPFPQITEGEIKVLVGYLTSLK